MEDKIYKLIDELAEFERLGVITRADDINNTLYIVIPRDLCKDNIKENIERVKLLGVKVFSKVKGVNEFYNMYGELIKRNKHLSSDEIVGYAMEITSRCNTPKDIDNLDSVTVKTCKDIFKKVTKEELEEIREMCSKLKILGL